jgi:hypothetical protein
MWFMKRLREPSSYAGVAAVICPVVSTLDGATDWATALPVLAAGVAAVILGEKTT